MNPTSQKSDQQEVRHVGERYIGKCNPWIVHGLHSRRSEGLMEKIEKEPLETLSSPFIIRLFYGLGKKYSREKIEKATSHHLPGNMICNLQGS